MCIHILHKPSFDDKEVNTNNGCYAANLTPINLLIYFFSCLLLLLLFFIKDETINLFIFGINAQFLLYCFASFFVIPNHTNSPSICIIAVFGI